MRKEFMEFLRQYGIIGLALAVVIGGKVNALVAAVVDGLLMPVVTFFIPNGEWRSATLPIGPIELRPGPVLAALLDFTIVAFVVFFIAKALLREQSVTKK
jgi:large conductance mechanosensitive channel